MERCHRMAQMGVRFPLQLLRWRLPSGTAGALAMSLLLPFGKVHRVGEAIEISSRCFIVCGDAVGTFLLPGSLLRRRRGSKA